MSEILTVGQASADLLLKSNEKQDVIETQQEMLKGYFDQLVDCAKRYDWLDPFYICVQTRRERTMVNVVRNQFYARRTRPIPQYDLALYWYDPKTEDLKFVWCIPSKDTVEYMVHHELEIPPDQHVLLGFCKSFLANTLI